MNLPSARKRHKKFTEGRMSHEGGREGGRAAAAAGVPTAEWRKQVRERKEEDFKTEFDVACSKELAS